MDKPHILKEDQITFMVNTGWYPELHTYPLTPPANQQWIWHFDGWEVGEEALQKILDGKNITH